MTIYDLRNQKSNSMKEIALTGMRLIVTGWAAFLVGLLCLLWLHALDKVHGMILPLVFLLWVILVLCLLDGRKAIAPGYRLVLFSVQAVAALLASVWFFRHLLPM